MIPGVSRAGIALGNNTLGNNISDYLAELYTPLFDVETARYKNLLVPVVSFSINTGPLKINTLAAC